MNLFKKATLTTTVTFAALLGLATLSFAQSAGTVPAPQAGRAGRGQHAGGGHMGQMLTQLNLTDAQKAQIKSIMQAERPKVKAVRQDSTLKPEDKRAKLQALRKDTMTQIGAILTPEQKEKLKSLRPHHGKGNKANGNA